MNYYDDYNFPGANTLGAQSSHTSRNKALLTGSRVYQTDGSAFYLSAMYYNEYGRLIESVSQNHLNGTDRVINTYNDITGELLTRTHSSPGDNVTIANRYIYDHLGRKKQSFQTTGGSGNNEVLLSQLEYNEIGQLVEKKLANNHQSTQYTYNERSWLKSQMSDQFSMNLYYQYPIGGALAQYNGNIANQQWGAGSSLPNVFSYGYDKCNRLTQSSSTGIAMIEGITYDALGNIRSLNRDQTGVNIYNYYAGTNKLYSIDNVTGVYSYDDNGNTQADGRTGMSLSYNYLNLPVSASKPGVSVSYAYNAAGQKLSKVSTVNGTTTTRHYVNGIEYNGSTIDVIQTETGQAQNNGGIYTYRYNLADHLGNVRYTFDIYNGTIRPLQQDNYYAFGKRNPVMNSIDNKYLYNGKELQSELSSANEDGQYDYGARFYDPVIARWNVIDPLAEKFRRWSPYNYCMDNPVRFVDPDGMGSNDPNGIVISDKILYDRTGKELSRIKENAPDQYFLQHSGGNYNWKTFDKKGNLISSQTAVRVLSKESFLGDPRSPSSQAGELPLNNSYDQVRQGELVNSAVQKVSGYLDIVTESHHGSLDFNSTFNSGELINMNGIYMNNHEALNYMWGASISAINNTSGKPFVSIDLALAGAEQYNSYDHSNTGRSPLFNQSNHNEAIVRGYLNTSQGKSLTMSRDIQVKYILMQNLIRDNSYNPQ